MVKWKQALKYARNSVLRCWLQNYYTGCNTLQSKITIATLFFFFFKYKWTFLDTQNILLPHSFHIWNPVWNIRLPYKFHLLVLNELMCSSETIVFHMVSFHVFFMVILNVFKHMTNIFFCTFQNIWKTDVAIFHVYVNYVFLQASILLFNWVLIPILQWFTELIFSKLIFHSWPGSNMYNM